GPVPEIHGSGTDAVIADRNRMGACRAVDRSREGDRDCKRTERTTNRQNAPHHATPLESTVVRGNPLTLMDGILLRLALPDSGFGRRFASLCTARIVSDAGFPRR